MDQPLTKNDTVVQPTILESIRKKPGIYIGDTENNTGIYNMLFEVINNSLDQFLGGKCTTISVVLHANNDIEVIDDGEGIQVHRIQNKPFIETVMTQQHKSASVEKSAIRSRGIGMVVINALSDYVEIDSFRHGVHYHQLYQNGKPGRLEQKGVTNLHGTRIKFHPTLSLWDDTRIEQHKVSKRLNELSCLNPGLKINFKDATVFKEKTHSENGLTDYIKAKVDTCTEVHTPIMSTRQIMDDTLVEFALCWASGQGMLSSFANQVSTADSSVHTEGIICGIAQSMKPIFGLKTNNIKALEDVISEGLYGIIHVNTASHQYSAHTKDRLLNEKVHRAIIKVSAKVIQENFYKTPSLKQLFVDRYISAQIHTLWHNLYQQDKKTMLSSNNIEIFLETQFDNPEQYSYILGRYLEFQLLFGGNNPAFISKLFLTGV